MNRTDERRGAEAERLTREAMADAGVSDRELELRLKELYGLAPEELPRLTDRGRSGIDPLVLAWLLTVHETPGRSGDPLGFRLRYAGPGPEESAAEIAALPAPRSLQGALLDLADRWLGVSGSGRLMYLAYPVCRYADEDAMEELVNRAVKRYGDVSRSEPPSLRVFRDACLRSRTRSAMLFAGRAGDMGGYLALRVTERSHPEAFVIRDGILTEYRGPGGDVVIPSGVTAIGERAFALAGNRSDAATGADAAGRDDRGLPRERRLTSVMIPDSVRSIGDCAFADCRFLGGVTVPESVERIGEGAFRGCERLAWARLPDALEEIGSRLFSGCVNLEHFTVPAGAGAIGDYAFADCRALRSVALPEGLRRVGRGAFLRCGSLVSVEIPAAVERIGDCAFADCRELCNVWMAEGQADVGRHAFAGCSDLFEILEP
jgi:hypothetical protein